MRLVSAATESEGANYPPQSANADGTVTGESISRGDYVIRRNSFNSYTSFRCIVFWGDPTAQMRNIRLSDNVHTGTATAFTGEPVRRAYGAFFVNGFTVENDYFGFNYHTWIDTDPGSPSSNFVLKSLAGVSPRGKAIWLKKADNFRIIDCVIELSGGNCIEVVDGDFGMIRGNSLSTIAGSGMYVGDSFGTHISSNMISTTASYGIQTANITGCVISDNVIVDPASNFITVQGPSSKVVISNNLCLMKVKLPTTLSAGINLSSASSQLKHFGNKVFDVLERQIQDGSVGPDTSATDAALL
jgi:hypothetical protein